MYRKGSRICFQRLRCLLKSTMGRLREKLQIQQEWEGTFASWLAEQSSDWHTQFSFPFLDAFTLSFLWGQQRKETVKATGQSKLCRTVCVRYISSDRLHDTSHLRKEDFIVSVCPRDGMAEYVVRALCTARNRKQGLAVTPQRPAPSGLDLPAGAHVQGFYNLPKLQHQLETKCSNMWAVRNISHSNHDPINGACTASDKKPGSLSQQDSQRWDQGNWSSLCRLLVLCGSSDL